MGTLRENLEYIKEHSQIWPYICIGTPGHWTEGSSVDSVIAMMGESVLDRDVADIRVYGLKMMLVVQLAEE